MMYEMTASGACVFSLPQPDSQTLRLRVTALACGAVRVTRTLREAFLPDAGDTIVDRTARPCAVAEAEDAFTVDCGGLCLRVSKPTGAITFQDEAGRALLRENEKRPCQMAETPVMMNRFHEDGEIAWTKSADGLRASSRDYETYEARRAYTCRLSLDFDEDEGLYGLGSHEEGFANLRGKSRDLYQHNLKAVVPVLVSTRGWGLLFDLGCLMAFRDDAEGSYLWADCADEMDCYFLSGGYASVCRQYADLTGHAPLLPRYAFGYVQSKERYRDAEELIGVVQEYRRRQVPLDLIVLDWQSWPEGQWGWKVFDESRFPDPQHLTDTLHRLGAKLMISIWPSMQGEWNENRREMLENGCMLGNRAIYNAFDEKARALYWKQADEGLFRHGVDAWWCDCSEPFEADWHGALKPEPFERVRVNTEEAKKYLDPGKISLYSLYHAMGVYQGQRKTTDRKRVLNLTRSSWAGQHRYAAVTWSGDISASWEALRRQVPEGLNFMATGEAWWTTDAGAFFTSDCGGAWFGAGEFPGGADDPGYRELFVRWMQYAAFLPMMRAHGTGTPREIWRFGEKGEPWYDALEKIIRLRSTLVPYLYSLAAEYARSGLPPVRVPALMFPGDARLRAVDSEMLLGDLLVRPVTRPMTWLPENRRLDPVDDTVDVYLPAGTDWYDLETGERHTGGQTLRVRAPIEKIPVFVRAGGMVPLGSVRQYVDELPQPPLTVTVFPGADGSFVLYDDAGDGYSYEQGECARITLTWRDQARELTLSAREGRWPGMAEAQTFRLRPAGGEEQVLLYTGEEVTVRL
ncbi:MAG: DUF5110 domain-containing protein [Clostridia bacterium]|nr:DUF5110 domain-containing protein [Clostridia bacterium]